MMMTLKTTVAIVDAIRYPQQQMDTDMTWDEQDEVLSALGIEGMRFCLRPNDNTVRAEYRPDFRHFEAK